MGEFPPLNCRDDLAVWIARVEEDLITGGVMPRSQWADGAILYLAGYEPLNMLMRQQRACRIEAGGLDMWTWEVFQESLSQLLEERNRLPPAIKCHRCGLEIKIPQAGKDKTKKGWNMPTRDMGEFPPLNCRDDLAAWIARVEEDLMTGIMPRSQWADGAMLYLAGNKPLNMLMRQKRACRMEAGGLDLWTWEVFQESLSQVLEERDRRTDFQRFREDHPFATTVAAASLITAGGVLLAPAILVGGLSVVGFSASGVVGGSIAAGIQSTFYGGLTTGLFSACQSIGATWVVGSGSIISGIGSLAAGATIVPGSESESKSESEFESESESKLKALHHHLTHECKARRMNVSPPPYS